MPIAWNQKLFWSKPIPVAAVTLKSWEMLGVGSLLPKNPFSLDFVSLQINLIQSLFNRSKVKENFTFSIRGRNRWKYNSPYLCGATLTTRVSEQLCIVVSAHSLEPEIILVKTNTRSSRNTEVLGDVRSGFPTPEKSFFSWLCFITNKYNSVFFNWT